MQRILLSAAVAGLLAVACASDSPVEVGSAAGAEAPSSTNSSSVPEPSESEGDDPIPGTRPVDAAVSLRPADALLRAEDVAGEWQEPAGSEFDGWEIGPNQTDCDPYWVVESLAASPSASRLWFQPGANLNHDVYDTGREAAAEAMAAAADLSESCPLLTWHEGGTLAISALPVKVPGVIALELFSDAGEVWWSAHADRENVVSRLQWVHFGNPGEQPSGDTFREFEELVTVMVDRLDESPAGPIVVDPPPDLPPSVTVPPVETLPSVASTVQPAPTPSPVDGHPLAGALLAPDDLPEGMAVDETLTYFPGDPDDQRIDGCAASESIVMLDAWFVLQRSFLPLEEGFEGLHLVGRASSVGEAESAVEMLASIADCDPSIDDEFVQASLDGGQLEGISDATATYLEVADQDLYTARLVAYQVGDVIGVVGFAAETGPLPPIETHRLLTQAAIDRAASV